MLFGAHCSTAGGPHMALSRARQIGADSVQIFVKSNMQWSGKRPSSEALRLYAQEFAGNAFGSVFGHTGYLINLGAGASPNREDSLRSLLLEIQIASDLGLPFLVMHPGAHLGQGERIALKQIVRGLDEVFAATKQSPVRIALENTAGQGTCLGYKTTHLAAIFDAVKCPERLGVCLDTAHLFAAGYDIRTPKGWDKAIEEVCSLIGLRQILGFHLNDSKSQLGSRVDRHEHIGRGKIGLRAFHHIVNDPRFGRLAGCIETPKSKSLKEDIANLATLRSLVKRKLISGATRQGSRRMRRLS
jgi:deoxyribonuclease-4